MKQVSQNLRNGIIDVEEVPIPGLKDNFVLVQNNFSIISSGTEKTKIDIGKKNLLQKAKSRPDLVKKVFDKIKSEGLIKTIKTVNVLTQISNKINSENMTDSSSNCSKYFIFALQCSIAKQRSNIS